MRKNLNPEELGDFLEQPKLAIVATHFCAGKGLFFTVWHEWREGGFTVLIFAGDIKARRIEHDLRMNIRSSRGNAAESGH